MKRLFLSNIALLMTVVFSGLADADSKDAKKDNAMKVSENSNMDGWQIKHETRIDKWTKNPDGSQATYEGEYIERNGIKVEGIGIGPDLEETFVCKGSFGEFKFIAKRWNGLANKSKPPEPRYIVQLYEPFIEKDQIALARTLMPEIESALLHMPLHPIHEGTLVKEVVFQVTPGFSEKTLVRVRDLNKGKM